MLNARGCDSSRRIRPTNTSSRPADRSGVGTSSTITPGSFSPAGRAPAPGESARASGHLTASEWPWRPVIRRPSMCRRGSRSRPGRSATCSATGRRGRRRRADAPAVGRPGRGVRGPDSPRRVASAGVHHVDRERQPAQGRRHQRGPNRRGLDRAWATRRARFRRGAAAPPSRSGAPKLACQQSDANSTFRKKGEAGISRPQDFQRADHQGYDEGEARGPRSSHRLG